MRPVDMYAYLRARFGVPNGIQNFLRGDDSDNLIHWDFNLRSGDEDVYIAGHSRDIHFLLSEALTDEQWKSLLVGLKADFGRVSREKGEITRSFEKYLVFQNKYLALADYCADLHARLVDAPPYQPLYSSAATGRGLKRHSAAMTEATKRANAVYRDSVTLSLLTPVMVEAFLNMLILTLRLGDCQNAKKAVGDYRNAQTAVVPPPLNEQGQVDRKRRVYRSISVVE